jgi:hypothetical protein
MQPLVEARRPPTQVELANTFQHDPHRLEIVLCFDLDQGWQ